MKITISYTVSAERVVEVDDKFFKLTDEGGFEDLPDEEREELSDELQEIASAAIGGSLPDRIAETDSDSLMWEC